MRERLNIDISIEPIMKSKYAGQYKAEAIVVSGYKCLAKETDNREF